MGKTTDIMQGFAIKQAIKYLEKDPEKNMMKVLDMVDAASPEGWYESPEDVDTFRDRTTLYAENWKPQAEKLWCKTCEECSGCK